ncbi:alpha-ketoglutarate-dependent dioxygenase AlkB [Corynebacterium halotolerans]|uniref:DNA repair protein n=1 Tax=Corynebacterium halotolerans YIM 70093 = DSM 44683 TaxID=1121362 RepID=M1MU37_9CORY|nr:alpha-ketoglutarate-dependent dioxygenase AlkB [Corynebacterium halotolerans]AGF71229.1 DNA repair protein [Corynebacterium halotolerans YIM 70093 = DSM 44683]
MPTLFDSGAGFDRPAVLVAPGVAHLPGWLPVSEQERLVSQARAIARSVAGTPLAMHRPVVGTGQMSAYILSLGRYWRTRPYGYVRSLGGVDVPAVPPEYGRLARAALSAASGVAEELAPWADGAFRAETALVNYYPSGASMGLHVDANEVSEAPVVSLSIGDEAVFRMGNVHGRTRPWSDVTLMSGDLVVFGGPARRAYHGVPVVRDGTAPAGCGLCEGRINITIRQVGL